MLKTQILILLTLLSSACSEDEPLNQRIDQERIIELLNLSSEQITVDGTKLELYAYLWRDFQPISPSDGKNLISINRLVDIDSVNIPDHIILSKQFVILGDSLWSADYSNEQRPRSPSYIIERVSRGGPKWGPNVEVTVIAKVINSATNSEHYLIKRNQLIARTD